MNVNDLPLIEKAALNMLLEGGGNAQVTLRRQLEAVKSVRRTCGGAGVYVEFVLNDDVGVLEGEPSFHLTDVFAKNEICDEVGFILFIKNGVIDFLEGYSFGDVYPSYDGCEYLIHRRSYRGL